MASNTTYRPTRVADFEASKLNFNAQGTFTTASANQITAIDFTLSDDCLITGAWVLTENGTVGDYCNFQVVDTSGAFTGTPNTVINQFVTNWYLPSSADVQLDMAYPAKIYAGLTLRVLYTSISTTTAVSVAINYKLHKVLV